MRGWKRIAGAWVALAVVAVGCAGAPAARQAAAPETQKPTTLKRITAAIIGNPPTLSMKVSIGGGKGHIPGLDELEDLVNTRLGMMDYSGTLRPQLAEVVPTVENGLWKVLPDGRMELTWKIKPHARWHDGAPFTADDLAFSFKAGEDKEIAVFRQEKYSSVEDVGAPDRLTFTARWKNPYIYANNMFDISIMPRHLLEQAYNENKAGFTELPYWREQFVGTGAYKLRQWAPGSFAVLEAFDEFVMGRPKIDEIAVRFIPDGNTLLANVLAGEIDVTMGLGISLDQALQVREQWKDGRIDVSLAGWVVIFPQLLYFNPPVVNDIQFRRALLHAIDRQAMADTIQAGLSSVAHSFVDPNQPEYKAVEGSIVRYDYDPRRATQLIEGLGYTRGPDGFFRDAANQKLSIELRTLEGFDVHSKTIFPVADYWQRAGVSVDTWVLTRTQAVDQKLRATFPGFELARNPNNMERLLIFRGAHARLPENNYVGTNYMNIREAEWDTLLDRYFSTIPVEPRNQTLAQLMHRITNEVLLLGLFYDVESSFIASRLPMVTNRNSNVRSPQAWNVHEWDIR